MNKQKISLFLSAGVQVSLVSASTYLIAHEKFAAVLLVGFLISLVWTWNVKRIAISNLSDRLIYAAGAGVGSLLGLLLTRLIFH